MKIGLMTLGCRVNQYESDAIAEKLEKKGYSVVDFEDNCDAYIINTCTVTSESDSKCKKAIRRAVRYGAPVAVIGCFVQGADNVEEFNHVTYLGGNINKGEVANRIEAIIRGEKADMRHSMSGASYENLEISKRKYVKAYVKIEDGCNNFCSYCYIPFVRGRVRSREENDILSEIKRLKSSGYREIILTGIETSAFGEDRGERDALCKLVERIQSESPVERLRFGSLRPSFFTPENSNILSSVGGVMPHFHLSVQSASDSILKAMKRDYTSRDLYTAVENIRKFFPDANLSCDMICGFPGETEDDFKESLDFIDKADILHTHVFPYSERKGTKAAAMTCQLPNALRHTRAAEMTRVASLVHRRIFQQNLGKEYNVLAEFFKNGKMLGYTENFINLRFTPPVGCNKGDIIKIKIDKDMDNTNR